MTRVLVISESGSKELMDDLRRRFNRYGKSCEWNGSRTALMIYPCELDIVAGFAEEQGMGFFFDSYIGEVTLMDLHDADVHDLEFIPREAEED